MTYEQKQCVLKFYGCYEGSIDGIWGEQSSEGTKKLQRALGLEADGIFGGATAAAVRAHFGAGHDALPELEVESQEAENWWSEIRYFSPEEFACKCHQFCDGYPDRMQELVVRICDRCREHFGAPITIVSGLRCRTHNTNSGGVVNSQHMYGEAADIHVWGVSAAAVHAWLDAQPEVRYTYIIPGSNNVHFDIPKQKR